MLSTIPRDEVTAFRVLWSLSNKCSFLSGRPVIQFKPTKLFYNCFAHILAKGQSKYPHFRLYVKNIWLLTPTEHHLLDFGTQDQRTSYSQEVKTANWNLLEARRDELIDEYNRIFPARTGTMFHKYSKSEVQHSVQQLNGEYLDLIKKVGAEPRSPQVPGKVS